jgi:hypothetical protein
MCLGGSCCRGEEGAGELVSGDLGLLVVLVSGDLGELLVSEPSDGEGVFGGVMMEGMGWSLKQADS